MCHFSLHQRPWILLLGPLCYRTGMFRYRLIILEKMPYFFYKYLLWFFDSTHTLSGVTLQTSDLDRMQLKILLEYIYCNVVFLCLPEQFELELVDQTTVPFVVWMIKVPLSCRTSEAPEYLIVPEDQTILVTEKMTKLPSFCIRAFNEKICCNKSNEIIGKLKLKVAR